MADRVPLGSPAIRPFGCGVCRRTRGAGGGDPETGPRRLQPGAGAGSAGGPPPLDDGPHTTLLLEVSAVDGAGHRAKGGGRVDVRYELWDEVFLVSAMGIDGRVRRESLPSFDRLLAWWRGSTCRSSPPLRSTPSPKPAVPGRCRCASRSSPFSQSEQRDTQRWLADSIERPQRGESTAPPRAEPLTGTLDASSPRRSSASGWSAMIGTSSSNRSAGK